LNVLTQICCEYWGLLTDWRVDKVARMMQFYFSQLKRIQLGFQEKKRILQWVSEFIQLFYGCKKLNFDRYDFLN
jgi:hypothetical protein